MAKNDKVEITTETEESSCFFSEANETKVIRDYLAHISANVKT